MRKPDRVEAKLDELSGLRAGADAAAIAPYLRDTVNIVVAKAARIAGELRLFELLPELAQSFDRLMRNPASLDKGCSALTAIVQALHDLEYSGSEIFLRGIRHVQMEPSFGPPVDAAVTLRGVSALGLVRSDCPNTLFPLVTLLADSAGKARLLAARALACTGDPAAIPVLHFKALIGDEEAEVTAECFSGLLLLAPRRFLDFVGDYIQRGNPAVAEAAILALSAARDEGALQLLADRWPLVTQPVRVVMIDALAASRHDAAIAFLIARIGLDEPRTAARIVTALAVHRGNRTVRDRVAAAVANDDELRRTFRAAFA